MSTGGQPWSLVTEETSVTKIACDKFIEAREHIINNVDTDFFKGDKYYEKKNKDNKVTGIGSASGVAAILHRAVS